MHHIFISYVAEDTDIAQQLAQGLEAAGYQTWHYTRDSLAGPSYLAQTAQAIEQSRAVVVVISRQALDSQQVTAEVVRAFEGGKSFLPVLRDITHEEFQQHQPAWRQAMGAAVSVSIPPAGVQAVVPRLVAGLKALDLQPARAVQPGD